MIISKIRPKNKNHTGTPQAFISLLRTKNHNKNWKNIPLQH